jgi:hypothetical protein
MFALAASSAAANREPSTNSSGGGSSVAQVRGDGLAADKAVLASEARSKTDERNARMFGALARYD